MLCHSYKMDGIFYEEDSEELPKTFKEYLSQIHKRAEKEEG